MFCYILNKNLQSDLFLTIGLFFLFVAIALNLLQVIFFLIALNFRLNILNKFLKREFNFYLKEQITKFKVKLIFNKKHQHEIFKNIFAAYGLVTDAVNLINSAYGAFVSLYTQILKFNDEYVDQIFFSYCTLCFHAGDFLFLDVLHFIVVQSR